MMRTRLLMTFDVHDAVDLDAQTDAVYEALLALEAADARLADADLEAALAEGVVTLGLTVTSDTVDGGLAVASSAIRAAIHAAGGATPGWVSLPAEPTGDGASYAFQKQEFAAA